MADKALLKSKKKDAAESSEIEERFDIDMENPIEQLGSKFATAYSLREKAPDSETPKESYLLAFNNNYVPREDVVAMFVSNNFAQSSAKIICSNKVTFRVTKSRKYCVVLPKPLGKSLREMIREKGALNERFVINVILSQLISELAIYNEADIAHGAINPLNIFFDADSKKIHLKECLSEFRGFSQEPIFEALNQLICHPAGKGTRDISADYYSLGMTLLYCLTGVYPIEGDEEEVLAFRLKYGSCDIMIERSLEKSRIKISQRMKDLLRGLLTDHHYERWEFESVYLWLKKDSRFPGTSNMHKKATSGLIFDDQEYFSIKYFAHDVYKKWDSAKRSLKIHDISRWVNLAIKNPDLARALDSLSSSGAEMIIQDDKIAKLIILLDQEGPIRHLDYSCDITGIGSLITYAYMTKERDIIQFIGTIFSSGIVDYWISKQKDPTDYTYSSLGWGPSKLIQHIQRSSLGFGMERALYELNKNLTCQSDLIINYNTGSLQELLHYLDVVADDNLDNDPMDRHISAFIAVKINMMDDIRIKSLQNFPYVAKNPQVLLTGLLTVAYQDSNSKPLKNLTNWISERLSSLINSMHSKGITRELKKNIKNAAKDGNLTSVFKVISAPEYVRRDLYGFQEARNQYQRLAIESAKLKTKSSIERLSYNYGLKISVIISYMVCVVTILYVLIRTP